MTNSIFISNVCLWMPPKDNLSAAPKLEFIDSIFRRRLSQLSKMTIQVVHDLFSNGIDRNIKLVFVSKRGEIARQFKINKTLIEENSILPAAFSLSTFNTPIALSTIAEGLKGGYTAIYPSHGNFAEGVLAAAAPVLCGKENKIAFVYADELIPDCYKDFTQEDNFPLALAALFSSQNLNNCVEYDLSETIEDPKDFIERFL